MNHRLQHIRAKRKGETMDLETLKAKKMSELREIARIFGVAKYETLRKSDLLTALVGEELPVKGNPAGDYSVEKKPVDANTDDEFPAMEPQGFKSFVTKSSDAEPKAKSEVKPDSKPEAKPDTKPESKAKSEAKPDARPESNLGLKSSSRPELQTLIKSRAKSK